MRACLIEQFLAVGLDISRKAQRVIARTLFGKLGVAFFQCLDDGEMFGQRGRDALGAADRELTIAAHVQQDVVGHVDQNRRFRQRDQRLVEGDVGLGIFLDMIRAWAALESMAARLITTIARKKDISALRDFFKDFNKDRLPQDHVDEYSKANIAFHQALISLSESPVLVDMTNEILLHVRGYRQLTIGRTERIAASLPEHLAIIEALEERNTEVAEKRSRDHTLGLAAFIEAHGQELV